MTGNRQGKRSRGRQRKMKLPSMAEDFVMITNDGKKSIKIEKTMMMGMVPSKQRA